MLLSQFETPPRAEHDAGPLTEPEVRFLLAAVQDFCRTRCPLAGQPGPCPLVAWRERGDTGALEKVCQRQPAAWAARLATLGRPAMGRSWS
jgi:hypothetical protein